MRARSIALVGMPGGGKSTIGRQLAKRLGWQFLDSDAVIEQRIGCSIRQFFEREGEARFREIEADILAELAKISQAVLATGGGAVLRESNRQLLHTHCHVVYLHSLPEDIHRRLRHDTQRPLLQVSDPLARLQELYAQRDALYRETAHLVIDTGRPSVSSLLQVLQTQLGALGAMSAVAGAASQSMPGEAPTVPRS